MALSFKSGKMMRCPAWGAGWPPPRLAVPLKDGQDGDKDRGGLEPGWGAARDQSGDTRPHHSEDNAGPEELGENSHQP